MCAHIHTLTHTHSGSWKSLSSCIVRFGCLLWASIVSVWVGVFVFVTVYLCVCIGPLSLFPSAFCFTWCCLFFWGQHDKDLTRYCKTAAATVTPPLGTAFPFPFPHFLCMAFAYTHTHTLAHIISLSVCLFCSPGLHFASMLHKLYAVKI